MESQQPTSTPSGIYCSSCGHLNASWRLKCENCRTQLVSPDRPAYASSSSSSSSRDRPGCVTAYAVLLGISAGLVALGGIIAGLGMMGGRYGNAPVGLLIIIIAGIGAGLEFLLARGLWQLKNWARTLVIVLQSLGLLGNLITACTALSASSSFYGYRADPTATICGVIAGLAVGGYIIYWFTKNREYFS